MLLCCALPILSYYTLTSTNRIHCANLGFWFLGILVWLELTFLLSVSGGGSTFNNIFDDSEDDDLLDATESPSSKQESAVFSALKTMVLFGGAMIASAVILGKIFL